VEPARRSRARAVVVGIVGIKVEPGWSWIGSGSPPASAL
jgi:hypothetical protein